MYEFEHGGAIAAHELGLALPDDSRFQDYSTILDFGCGPGRVLPHVAAQAPKARCIGVDVDEEAIEWANDTFPYPHFYVSSTLPPLRWSKNRFDLIYSISVFSHLSEADQNAWLAEMARLLMPDGVALLSTHGETAFEAFRSGKVSTSWCEPGAFRRASLGPGEIVSIPYRSSRWSRSDLRGTGQGYGLTFHSEGYIRENWTRHLAVQRIIPKAITGWQDLVVCRGF